MQTRYRIETPEGELVLDLAVREAFKIDGYKYPSRWLNQDGKVAGHVVVPYTPDVPVPVVRIPRIISKLQFVRALRAAGHWNTVKSSLKQESTIIKEDWEYSFEIGRNDAIVVAFMATLNFTEADMNTIFLDGRVL